MKNSIAFTIALFSMLAPTACKKDHLDPAKAPLLVKTSTAFAITENSVMISSMLASDGASPITDYGHVYSETSGTPSLGSSIKIPNGSFSGVFPAKFSSTLGALKSNTTYHIRPYATNNVGTSYGDVMDIKTALAMSATPLESSTTVDDLTANSFHVTSTISSNGKGFITQYGHVCSTSKSPTLYAAEMAASDASKGQLPAKFSNDMANLESNTTYYVRPFATNEKGTLYGSEIEVKTTLDEPSPTRDKRKIK